MGSRGLCGHHGRSKVRLNLIITANEYCKSGISTRWAAIPPFQRITTMVTVSNRLDVPEEASLNWFLTECQVSLFVDSALICVEAFAAPRPQWPGIYIMELSFLQWPFFTWKSLPIRGPFFRCSFPFFRSGAAFSKKGRPKCPADFRFRLVLVSGW